MFPYYGTTINGRKPLLPQLRAAVQNYTDRWGVAPGAIYLRDPAGVALVGTVPVQAIAHMPRGVIGLSVPEAPARTPLGAAGYAQAALI